MKNHIYKLTNTIGLLSLLLLTLSTFASAQTSTFTFQGRLNDNSLAAQGNYEMRFSLYDAVSGGNQIGSTIDITDASVINGVFTVRLDFGVSSFDGGERFIETAVRRDSSESYVTLNPRQLITSVPYAVRAVNANQATNADNASNSDRFGGLFPQNYVQNIITGPGILTTRLGPNLTISSTHQLRLFRREPNLLPGNGFSMFSKITSSCGNGETAINGGVHLLNHDTIDLGFARRIRVTSNGPSETDPRMWVSFIENVTDNTASYRQWVLCQSNLIR